jgi:apolipoprotein D and lipocalin family protein
MKLYPIILLVACTIGGLRAQNTREQPPLNPVEVTLKSLSGTWYEISRLPNAVDSDLNDVSITYYVSGDKKMKQILQGTTDKGKKIKLKSRLTYTGKGEITGPMDGKYIILAVGPNYEYFMMGTPDRKYLWIMSRKKTMENNTYNVLVSKADKMDYAILMMQMTAHK